jgi:hypothetical protein
MLLLAASPLAAQWNRHNFTFGGGPALPGGDLQPFFSNTGLVRVGYGYRFHGNFQAETGLDVGFRAARVNDFYESQFGALKIRDYQYMWPMGGRAILPVGDRFQFHAGGGGVYLRYTEGIRQPFQGFRLDCPVCRSRGGWGYYGLAGGSVAIGESERWRIGGTVTLYRARTDGDSFGDLPAITTRDRWINTAIEVGFGF